MTWLVCYFCSGQNTPYMVMIVMLKLGFCIMMLYRHFEMLYLTASRPNNLHVLMLVIAMQNLLLEIMADIFTEACVGVDLALVKFWYTETLRNSL